MLDGAARINELLDEAVRLGQIAMAITDHGYMFGAYPFYRAARKRGIKPIIGIEAYLTPGTSRFDRSRVNWGSDGTDDVAAGGAYTHLTLLARSTAGMHNLFRLASLASMEGQYYKPRMDLEILAKYGSGLIGTSGCPGSEVQTRLRLGQYDQALAAAATMQDIFGKENYFIELMEHGLDIERRTREDLLRISKQLNAPLLATNDLHYTTCEDAKHHEALLCLQSASVLSDPTQDEGGRRFAFRGDTYYLRSAQEMRRLFSELPQACDNTMLVAEMCETHFVEEVGRFMPHYPVPAGRDEKSHFVTMVWEGLATRYGGTIPQEAKDRCQYELDVICSKGYAGYYLVVADFINWAKEQGIRVGPGRGSGASSIAAWALRITELDPIEHGLLFERFLNPERMSMPDFDIDFDERRRSEVVAYVSERYGSERVAHIVTYSTIKGKQALRDSARINGFPYALGDQLSKAMPQPQQGSDISLAKVFDPAHDRYAEGVNLRELYEESQDAKTVVDTALGLEDLKRQWGVHAAGVIISNQDLIDVIPIMRREQDGAIITQIDFPDGEALGLVKMDFLGLRNLTMLDDALANIVRNGKEQVVLEDLTLDDPETYALLARAETLGVFQFDSPGYQRLCKLMRPTEFADVTALGALYRPGPMGTSSHINYALRKNKQQQIDFIHPELTQALTPILGETYGLMIYQEHVLRIAQDLAGYSLGQADMLRKAVGKKSKEVLANEFVPFQAGMRKQGYSDAAITTLWDVMTPFASYAFNKAHAAAYGLVSYWTAYLKAHYPVEFMSGLLTSVRDDKARSAEYLAECRRMGITVLPPDVNASIAQFAAIGADIRFGLESVRNVGRNVVDAIVAAREEKGDFNSFVDFLAKVPLTVCNKRTVESLIKAGAFDSLGTSRRALMVCHEQFVDEATEIKRAEAIGQFDLFSVVDEEAAAGDKLSATVPQLPEWDMAIKLGFEREMLGRYVSSHPLEGMERTLAANSKCGIAQLLGQEDPPDSQRITIAGIVSSSERRVFRTGKQYLQFVLEDLDGALDVRLTNRAFDQYAQMVLDDAVMSIEGVLRVSDSGYLVYANKVRRLSTVRSATAPIVIMIPEERCQQETVDGLRTILENNPGSTEVMVRVTSPQRVVTLALPDELRVERRQSLYEDLRALLGPAALISDTVDLSQ